MDLFPNRDDLTVRWLVGWGLSAFLAYCGVKGLVTNSTFIPTLGESSGPPLPVTGSTAVVVSIAWLSAAIFVNLYWYWYDTIGGQPWMEIVVKISGLITACAVVFGVVASIGGLGLN